MAKPGTRYAPRSRGENRVLRLLIAGLVPLAVAAGSALAAPSTNVLDYVLLAGEELDAKWLVVQSGDVGVSAGILRSHNGLDAPASRVAADVVDIDPSSSCLELSANAVVETGACGPATGLASPLFPDLGAACGFPEPPAACDPGRPVTVGHRRSQVLPPGVYGHLGVAGGSPGRGTLILEGGEYVFCSVHLGPRARLLVRSPATIQVAGDANFGLGTTTGPAVGSGLAASDIRVFVGGDVARLQRRADLVGRICVPGGLLQLVHGARLEGQGVAREIRTGRVSVRGLGLPGGTTTSTLPPFTTTSTSTSTSSTVEGTTSTSSTSSSSVPGTSTSSTTGTVPSTTTTSTSLTTSSTGVVPTTTSTSTTSTSAPAPTTSTSSTTSTTVGSSVCGNGMIEGAETCDDGNTVNADACPSDCRVDPCDPTQNAAAVLAVTLDNQQGGTFGVGTVFIDYPEGVVLIPGSADDGQVQAAVTDRPTVGAPTCLVNDRDHGLQFGCLSFSGGFPDGLLFRVAFRDCQAPGTPTLQDFSCEVLEATDTIGSPVSATCSLQLQ